MKHFFRSSREKYKHHPIKKGKVLIVALHRCLNIIEGDLLVGVPPGSGGHDPNFLRQIVGNGDTKVFTVRGLKSFFGSERQCFLTASIRCLSGESNYFLLTPRK